MSNFLHTQSMFLLQQCFLLATSDAVLNCMMTIMYYIGPSMASTIKKHNISQQSTNLGKNYQIFKFDLLKIVLLGQRDINVSASPAN